MVFLIPQTANLGFLLRRQGQAASVRHHLCQQSGLKLLDGHGFRQVCLDVGHGADGRLRPSALEAVVLPVGGDLIQHAQVGRKQQGAVVEQPSLGHPLCAAGDLLIADGDVAEPILPGGNANGIQGGDDRIQNLVIVHRPVGSQDVGVVDIPQIVVHRPTAGHPAHHGDPTATQGFHMDFPTDVLVAAHHHGRGILPEKKEILVRKCLVDILLKGLIVERVVRTILHSEHRQTLAFLCDKNHRFCLAYYMQCHTDCQPLSIKTYIQYKKHTHPVGFLRETTKNTTVVASVLLRRIVGKGTN